jgi:hypothetical protein
MISIDKRLFWVSPLAVAALIAACSSSNSRTERPCGELDDCEAAGGSGGSGPTSQGSGAAMAGPTTATGGPDCKQGGEVCEAFGECCSGTCANQVCTTCAGFGEPCGSGCCVTFSCYEGTCGLCKQDGDACNLASECCSNICYRGNCAACKELKAPCTVGAECCDGFCIDGFCAASQQSPCEVTDGDPPCFACIKPYCCDELTECAASADCTECLACLQSGDPNCMSAACNFSDPATNGFFNCFSNNQSLCSSQCGV